MLLLEKTNSLRREKLYHGVALALFIGMALLFNAPYLKWLPRGYHEWAQSDRLALALGYYDYRFDFFHPRTLSLVTVDRVTGTELPLQAYIASFFGLIAGRENITVAFRCLDIAMMVVGFYYLFRLMYESTGNFIAGLVPAAFLLASPIFIYYSGNYTPDPFSASLLFIAIYHYWRYYYRGRQFRFLLIGTALSGLAMLVKVTSGVYFFAFTGLMILISYFWPAVLTTKQKIQYLALVSLVISALLGYFLYHKYLNTAYGSGLFLNGTMPIKSWASHKIVWTSIWAKPAKSYFTHVDYALLRVSWILLAIYLVVRWRHMSTYLPALALLGIGSVGILIMYVLLGVQLVAHDYYIIAPLLPLLMMVVCSAIWILCNLSGRRVRLIVTFLLLVATIAPVVAGFRHHRTRMYDPSDGYAYRWELGGEEKLQRLGVPKSSFIMVLGEGPSNLALIHFNRLGVVWDPDIQKITADSVLHEMAGRRLEYLVMRQELLNTIKQQNPALLVPFREVQLEGESAILQPIQKPVEW